MELQQKCMHLYNFSPYQDIQGLTHTGQVNLHWQKHL